MSDQHGRLSVAAGVPRARIQRWRASGCLKSGALRAVCHVPEHVRSAQQLPHRDIRKPVIRSFFVLCAISGNVVQVNAHTQTARKACVVRRVMWSQACCRNAADIA